MRFFFIFDYNFLCFRFLASLIAVFGEYDISGELESKRSVTRPVRRVIVHRHYDAATFENDIALLELDSPVQFDQHIVPICMPKDAEDFTGRIATVTGWGRLKYGMYYIWGRKWAGIEVYPALNGYRNTYCYMSYFIRSDLFLNVVDCCN